MRLKADWQDYLRTLRRREIELIFGRCPPLLFGDALELGAGDGSQGLLLARYAHSLVSTDYRPSILREHDGEAPGRISYRQLDAEVVGDAYPAGSFDLVFSSNMMEHLPDPGRALAGIRRVLRDDGLSIHVMPSPFWKLCHLIGFYPNAVASRVERLTGGSAKATGAEVSAGAWDNNPKASTRSYGRLRRLLAPVPHGAMGSNLAELAAFQPARWRKLFAQHGFEVAAVVRGPVSSGYGFGFDGLRAVAEGMGLASEYAYVTLKTGCTSPHLAYFAVQETPAGDD